MSAEERQRVITIELENEAGILFRVAGLFSARGYNIDSLAVAKTHDASRSHMTIVTHASDRLVKQVVDQLNKLVGVCQVCCLDCDEGVQREAVIVKLRCDQEHSQEHSGKKRFRQLVEDTDATLIEQDGQFGMLSLLAKPKIVEQFIASLEQEDIIEIVRSGVISLRSDDKTTG